MHSTPRKVLARGWINFFVSMISFGIVMDLATIGAMPWISSSDSYYGFEGSIMTLTEAEGDFFEEVEGYTYSSLREKICDIADDTGYDGYEVLCQIFKDLEASSSAVIVGIGIGIIWSVGAIVQLRKLLNNSDKLKWIWVFPLLSIFNHSGVSSYYVSTNYVAYSGSCGELFEGSSRGFLCAEVGVNLLTSSSTFHFALMGYIVVLTCLRRRWLTRPTRMVPLGHNVGMMMFQPVHGVMMPAQPMMTGPGYVPKNDATVVSSVPVVEPSMPARAPHLADSTGPQVSALGRQSESSSSWSDY